MKTDAPVQLVKIALLVILAVLLIVDIAQHNAIEERQVETNKRLRELAAAQEKTAKALERGVVAAPAQTGTPPPPVKPPVDRADYEVRLDHNFLAPIDRSDYDPRRDGGTIQRYFGTDPKGWNLITENAADTSELYEYITEPLARQRLDDPDVWESRLAESCIISADFKTYTLRLRRGVRWHAPAVDFDNAQYAWLKGEHPVTAHDVKFYVDLILNPQVEAGHLKNYFEDCAGAEAPDDHTLIVRWKKKTYTSIDATLYLYPLPRFLFGFDEHGRPFPPESLGTSFNKHWYNDKAIGCGAYRFVEWKPGVHILLEKNPDYFGRPAHIEKMRWHIIRDPDTILNRLKVGEIDIAGLYPSQYRREILEAKPGSPFLGDPPKIRHDQYLQFVYFYIGWNLGKPLFSDKRVRRAMTHAFPKEKILKHVFQGLGIITSSPFFIKHPATDPAIKPWPNDLDEARRLLQEAGWSDSDGDGVLDRATPEGRKPFEFQLLLYANSSEYRDLGNIFKEELLKIGVKMTPLPVDWSLMQKRMEDKEFDAYTGGWGLVWNNDPYQIWHSSQVDVPKGSNRIGFRNEEVDRLIETLRETFDRKKRVTLLRRIHAIIHDEQPYTFFYTRKLVPAWHGHVRNVNFFLLRPQTFSLTWYLQRP